MFDNITSVFQEYMYTTVYVIASIIVKAWFDLFVASKTHIHHTELFHYA